MQPKNVWAALAAQDGEKMKVKQLIKHLAHIPTDAEVIFINNQGKRYKVDTMVCHGGEVHTLYLFEVNSENEQEMSR